MTSAGVLSRCQVMLFLVSLAKYQTPGGPWATLSSSLEADSELESLSEDSSCLLSWFSKSSSFSVVLIFCHTIPRRSLDMTFHPASSSPTFQLDVSDRLVRIEPASSMFL